MTTRRIDPTLYTQAADAFDAVATSADSVGSSARSSAGGYARMAGDDPGGEQFASAYDDLAGSALQNIFDIGLRANNLDRLFMASGANAASAEAVASGQPFDAGSFTLRPARSPMSVAPPPSAFGGTAGEPKGWEIVTDFVGMMWPNADTDQLDQAAQTWKDIARDVRRLATQVQQGDNAVASLDSVELVKARSEVSDFASDIREVADFIEDMGTQCAEYADDVREAHKEVIEMLVQLAVEIAATVAISAALSAFTFGASAAVGAGAMAARIAVIGGRIITILTRVGGTAARVAVRIRAIRASLIPFALRFQRPVQAAINVASGTAAAVTSEVIVKRGDANLLVAFASGLAGGAVTEAIVSPFGRYGQRVAVQALAGGGGGAAGAATDGLISDGSIDPRQVVISAIGGGAFSGWGARGGSGRGGSSSAADPGRGNVDIDEPVPVITGGNNAEAGGPDGGRTGSTDYEGPNVTGGNDVSGGGGDGGGQAGSTDYEGPNVTGGNDVSGGGGDGGGGPRVPDGEAPTPTGDEGLPPAGTGGSGGGSSHPISGGADPVDIPTPPVTPGGHGDDVPPPPTGSGDGSRPDDADTPIFHETETDLGVDVDGDGHVGAPPADGPGAAADAPEGAGIDAPAADPVSSHDFAHSAGNPPAPHDPAVEQPLTPAQQEIIAGTDPHGPLGPDGKPAWVRYQESPQDLAELAGYNQPKPSSGEMNPAYRPDLTSPPGPAAQRLGYDPAEPFGHAGYGGPAHSEASWNRAYVDAPAPGEKWGNMQFAPNSGAVPGTRVQFSDVRAFLDTFGHLRIDRLGNPNGAFMGIGGGDFNARALPPGQRSASQLTDVVFTGKPLPDNMVIEISMIADAYGRDGGALQVVVRDPRWPVGHENAIEWGPQYLKDNGYAELSERTLT